MRKYILVAGDINDQGGVITVNLNTHVTINKKLIVVDKSPVSPYGVPPIPALMVSNPKTRILINGIPICMTTDVDTRNTAVSTSIGNNFITTK